MPVAIRSGGHSYPGWSAGDGALVVDVRPLDRVSLSGTTATVGAGASLVQVYDALGTRGRGIAGGSCPTVGIAGLTQGGGVGVLTRAYGLTCDSVTAMQVVLADGTDRHRERRRRSPTCSGPCAAAAAGTSAWSRRSRSRPSRHRRSPAPTSPGRSPRPARWCRTGCATIPQRRPAAVGDAQAARRRRPTRAARRCSCRRPGPVRRPRWTPRCARSSRRCPTPVDRLAQHRELPRHDAHLRRLLLDPGRPVPHRAGRLARPRGVRRDVPHHHRARRRHERAARPRAAPPRAAGSRRPASRSTPWAARSTTSAAATPRSATAARWPRCSTPRRTTSGPATPATAYVRGFRDAR